MDIFGRIPGAVTVVTGFEKGSGKTTFLNLALPYARRRGPVAIFGIGVDGALKARESSRPAPAIHLEAGDLVITTEAFARASSAQLEVLESLGSGSLGRLFLGRALRGGSATVVGPEHLGTLAGSIARVRQEGWAESILVDGAINRITQVGALGEVAFVYTVRVDRGNLTRVAARLRGLDALMSLPPAPPEAFAFEGPLTPSTLKTLPEGCTALSLEDFTKCFLEPEELLRLLGRLQLSLRRRFDLVGISAALRDLSRTELLAAVGESVGRRLCFNPCEVSA